tara:strand:- start:775 stop:1245 length:471 start_codon:yes stop_codon:yes gene_type:complete
MKKNIIIILSIFISSFVFAAEIEFLGTGKFNLNSVKTDKVKYVSAIFDQTLVVNKSNSSFFKVGDIMVGRKCIGYSKTIKGKTILEGSCIYKDSQGDSIFAIFDRKGNAGESGSGGQLKMEGISGKFKDFNASCKYEAKYIKNQDLYLVNFAKCTH